MKEMNEVPCFLLSDDFKEDNVYGRISHYFISNESEEKHLKNVETIIEELENVNEDNYTRWVHTKTFTKHIGNAVGYVSVFHFRIRDSY